MSGNWIFGLCLFPLLIEVTAGNSLTFDLGAERRCMVYKKVCPQGKRCAIQNIQWPMNMSFPVCVPKKYFPVKMHVCELPPEPGNCGARFMRWYYNRHSQKCTLFKYQGCNGNMNNFKSRAECQASCYPQNTLQNDARHGYDNPRALAVSRPLIVSESEYVPMRTNQKSRNYSVHARKKTKPDKEERRRKRRLQKQKRRRLRKLRRRRKKKGLRSKKRRRSGKLNKDKKGRKNKQRKRNKKNKKRKNKRKKIKKDKKKIRKNPKKDLFDITEGGVSFQSNDILTTTTLIPDIKKKIPISKTESIKPLTLYSILDPKKPTEEPMIER